jgi:hypothetical protein
MRFFVAGIMQGSHTAAVVHDQDYRARIAQLINDHFPHADVYDPRANHCESLGYDNVTGGRVYSYPDGGPYRIDIAYEKFPGVGKNRPFYWLIKGRIVEKRIETILQNTNKIPKILLKELIQSPADGGC